MSAEEDDGTDTVPAAAAGVASDTASDVADAVTDATSHVVDAVTEATSHAADAATDATSHVAADDAGAGVTPPSGPGAIEARDLGLLSSRGWVFRHVDLTVPPHTVAAVAGSEGRGKSALLLALTGRMRVSEGSLRVAGIDAAASAGAVRARTAVARLQGIVTLEPELTVAETVAERSLIDGVRPRDGRAAFAAACQRAGVSFDPGAVVGRLPAVRRGLLALLVTAVRPADVVVVDDTDAGVTLEEEREIYRVAAAFAAEGPAIVASTTRSEALPPGATVIDLAAAAAEPAADREEPAPEKESGTAGEPEAGSAPDDTEGEAAS